MTSWASTAQIRVYLPQLPAGVPEDAALQAVLDRATGIVRDALRAATADATLDFSTPGAASTQIVTGYGTAYLSIPAHVANSVTLVEYQSVSSPITWAAVSDTWAEEGARLYRPGGWAIDRYRITAVWGYGAVPPAIEEVTLEVGVNIWRRKDSGGFTELMGASGEGAVRAVMGLTKQQQQVITNTAQLLWKVSV